MQADELAQVKFAPGGSMENSQNLSKPAPKSPPMVGGALPVIGNALEFQKNRAGLIQRGYEKYGSVFGFKLGPQPVAALIGPELQQLFFTETDKKLSMDKPYRSLRALFGDVAFLASKETYKEQRPMLYAPFTGPKMVQYVRTMQDVVQGWLDSLESAGEMDITAEIGRLVQNVAGYALMGPDFQREAGREFWALYADLGKSLDLTIPPDWPLPKNIRRDRAKARMSQILAPIVAERRAHPERYDDFLQDFVNTPLKSGQPAEDETVISLIRALMFAGHETTAGQAAWTVIELLLHPDAKQRVVDEIDEHLPPGARIDAGVMRKLQNLAWSVREVERMHPSADILMRYAEEDLEAGDYVVPQGWLVTVVAGVAHRLPAVFRDPDKFDPLRYAPDRAEDAQHRFALIGFGGGLHKCAGVNFANNEMMVITSLLLQQFDIELIDKNPKAVYGLGASRPSRTRVHYRRKWGTLAERLETAGKLLA
jgi:sterol 14alpha-demethylase